MIFGFQWARDEGRRLSKGNTAMRHAGRLKVVVEPERVRIGERFSVSFERTLRVPDDGKKYPLPPSLGSFPIQRVKDFEDRVPSFWKERNSVFIPMYEREAMWLAFEAPYWRPNAVKVGVGRINGITGSVWDLKLHATPQDYIVCPLQPWLDGINIGDGTIRQFVAMPVGLGNSIEFQITGKEEEGGIQIAVFEAKEGIFPDKPPDEMETESAFGPPAMGISAGGRITQKIYPDPYGLGVWNQDNYGAVYVYIIDARQYKDITGKEAPPTPISADTYIEAGLPWFELDDQETATLPSTRKLRSVQSTSALSQARPAKGKARKSKEGKRKGEKQ